VGNSGWLAPSAEAKTLTLVWSSYAVLSDVRIALAVKQDPVPPNPPTPPTPPSPGLPDTGVSAPIAGILVSWALGAGIVGVLLVVLRRYLPFREG
jgi:hypothetical protein